MTDHPSRLQPGTTPPGTTPSAAPPPAAPSPAPRRLRGPSWLDLRLVAGVLLVLISVIGGARLIVAADTSVRVWAAVRDLGAGTTLRAEDLQLVQVRLFDSGPRYLAEDADLPGRILDRPVRAGELLPASALQASGDRVSVALSVPAGAVPAGLSRGQLIDVYAVGVDQQGGPVVTRLVLAAVPVQAVDGADGGVLSASGGDRQIVVSVDADAAGAVLAAIAGRELAVAVLEAPVAPSDRGLPTGPVGDPAVPSTPTAAPEPTSAAPPPGGPPVSGASTTAPQT